MGDYITAEAVEFFEGMYEIYQRDMLPRVEQLYDSNNPDEMIKLCLELRWIFKDRTPDNKKNYFWANSAIIGNTAGCFHETILDITGRYEGSTVFLIRKRGSTAVLAIYNILKEQKDESINQTNKWDLENKWKDYMKSTESMDLKKAKEILKKCYDQGFGFKNVLTGERENGLIAQAIKRAKKGDWLIKDLTKIIPIDVKE